MLSKMHNDGTLYQGDVRITNELIDEANLNRSYSKMVVPVAIAEDASAGFEFVAPFDMDITSVEALCTEENSGGTLTLRREATLISGSVICAVENTVSATTVVVAQRHITEGETLNVIASGNDATLTRGVLLIEGIRH